MSTITTEPVLDAHSLRRRRMKLFLVGCLIWLLLVPYVVAAVVSVSDIVSCTAALTSGAIKFGDPGYEELHSALDRAVIIAGICAVLLAGYWWLSRWYRREYKLLCPKPGRITIRELPEGK